MKNHLVVIITAITIMFIGFVFYESSLAEELSEKNRTSILNSTAIRVFKTDTKGTGLDPSLNFKSRLSEGTKCYWCIGVPKECDEIDCSEIVIVHTD